MRVIDHHIVGHQGGAGGRVSEVFDPNTGRVQAQVTLGTQADLDRAVAAAEADHSLLKKLYLYQAPEVLVIDEVGYLPLGNQGSNLFFQVISARHEKKSTVITTNLPFADWGKIFDSTTVATAIADRLVNNSEVIIFEGPSYRTRSKAKQVDD